MYRQRQDRYLRKKLQEARKEKQSKPKGKRKISDPRGNASSTEQLKVKLYTEFLYQAKTWSKPRRIICKVELSEKGENIRFIVTNLQLSRTAYIYETIYCGRGQMENYIKDHKRFLHSDRTSCHKFEANQFRLFLHSAAYMFSRVVFWCSGPYHEVASPFRCLANSIANTSAADCPRCKRSCA